MSYKLAALTDTPKGLWMLDGALTDYSGRLTSAGIAGTIVEYGPAMVANADKSTLLSATITLNVPFVYAKAGTEKQPFSLEAWVFPIGSTISVLSHATDQDGIAIKGNDIVFSIKLTTGVVEARYTPMSKKSFHVVGTYNTEAVSLYVDGVLVASTGLTEAQQAASFSLTTPDDKLYCGGADVLVQGLATYESALTTEKIERHYKAGKAVVKDHAVASTISGTDHDITLEYGDLFDTRFWVGDDQWRLGYMTCVLNDGAESAVDSAGAYISSTWTGAFNLIQGRTSINGVKIEWRGQGSYTVETSLDGTTWSAATNGGRVTGITNGYNPTDKTLFVRITFAAATYGRVRELYLFGYKSTTINGNQRPLTGSTAMILHKGKELIGYDVSAGINANSGTVTVGVDSATDATNTKSVSFWYYAKSGATTSNFTNTTFYENGVARAARVVLNRWTLVHMTHATGQATAITFSGDVTYRNICTYKTTLTAAQCLQSYRSYTGIPVTAVTSATATTISAPAATIYAADWSFTGAG